jgi:hypothetical protein|tara:strand:+ start:75 stop:464 length:390 start_codon:yes stop_codon:yes gene_type:complete
MNDSKIKIGTNRSFGIVFCVVFLIISLWPLKSGNELNLFLLLISVIFLLLGLTNSKLLSPLNTIWFKFGLFLGKIVSPVVMGIIFFFVVTPIALILKIFRKDVLNLKKNNNNSYWIEKTGPKSKMKNQF